eukprot:Gregarina_sp_Poly_1__3678@NODE_2084_length_2713_cov_28_418745_g1344_i0_p3_GENE_NODE_2084_length_2713_cov_28_418745_g1344_i0NODE_2084_length_2713_cov_28_418745_g1344_i0_p3_ORF_typecomplete_len158_score6_00DUF4672/PF15716_5/0_75_NODE_2084_length_2713_cov_28_418745_g1344_i012641737
MLVVHYHAPFSCAFRDKTDSLLYLAFPIFPFLHVLYNFWPYLPQSFNTHQLQHLLQFINSPSSIHFVGLSTTTRRPSCPCVRNSSAASPALIFDSFLIQLCQCERQISHTFTVLPEVCFVAQCLYVVSENMYLKRLASRSDSPFFPKKIACNLVSCH